MADPFIREYIQELLTNIRMEVLIKLIKPYTRIRIPFISEELNIPAEEVEQLLVTCVLDGTVAGRIDQVNQLLVMDTAQAERATAYTPDMYAAVRKWAGQINAVGTSIQQQLS